jgi:uncharacterized membrane protein
VDDVTIVRAVHVLSVVLWIGGVGFVTTVMLPAVRHLKAAEDRLTFFDTLERRFAWQARIATVFTGLTGLYMVIRLNLWDRFLSVRFWWMHAMVVVWLLFSCLWPSRSSCIAGCWRGHTSSQRQLFGWSSGCIGSS